MKDLSQLIDDQLDGLLTSDGALQLSNWLKERDANVREFATRWLIHSLIHDYMSQRQVQADALLRALTSSAPATRSAGSGPPARRPVLFRAKRFRPALVTIAIASLLLIGGATWFLSRPKVVAMLTQTANCRWVNSGRAIDDGALFREGDELRLAEGRALITFISGARLVMEGPAAVSIESDMAAALAEGAATARVPVQAVGFAIHTPRAHLVDLGTEFTVRTHADGGLELQVFDGMVELSLLGPDGEPADAPLQITEGTAVKADANSRGVQAIKYDANQRMTLP